MIMKAKKMAEHIGVPYYSVMKLYKTGVIPGISIGQGRGSKLLFDVDLVEEALRTHMLEDQHQRQIICEGRT